MTELNEVLANAKDDPLEKRFLLNTDKTANCWLWEGAKFSNGSGQIYGRITFHYKRILAHRASWIIHNGTIPDGLQVCHHCDNSLCVNPAHLFLGTQLDNVIDMLNKGRGRQGHLYGELNKRALLSNSQVKKIKEQLRNNYFGLNIKLANEYGVSPQVISRIKRGICWREI